MNARTATWAGTGSRIAEVRAGSTEPLDIVVALPAHPNLDDIAEGVLFARKVGSPSNHVNGAPVIVATAEAVRFDPVGNGPGGADAFGIGDAGEYDCYVRLTWADGHVTRHPGAAEMLRLVVAPSLE